MQHWDMPTWISVLALVVSGLSLSAAVWAAWVSHRTLTHAKRVHDEDRRLLFERERAALLEVINTSRGILDRTRIRIGTMKANFDAAPTPVKNLLSNYTGLFTEYYPRVEAGVRQASALWDEVASWSEQTGVQAIVQHQAKYRALLHEDQVAHDQSIFLVETFERKFAEATERVASVPRAL